MFFAEYLDIFYSINAQDCTVITVIHWYSLQYRTYVQVTQWPHHQAVLTIKQFPTTSHPHLQASRSHHQLGLPPSRPTMPLLQIVGIIISSSNKYNHIDPTEGTRAPAIPQWRGSSGDNLARKAWGLCLLCAGREGNDRTWELRPCRYSRSPLNQRGLREYRYGKEWGGEGGREGGGERREEWRENDPHHSGLISS